MYKGRGREASYPLLGNLLSANNRQHSNILARTVRYGTRYVHIPIILHKELPTRNWPHGPAVTLLGSEVRGQRSQGGPRMPSAFLSTPFNTQICQEIHTCMVTHSQSTYSTIVYMAYPWVTQWCTYMYRHVWTHTPRVYTYSTIVYMAYPWVTQWCTYIHVWIHTPPEYL